MIVPVFNIETRDKFENGEYQGCVPVIRFYGERIWEGEPVYSDEYALEIGQAHLVECLRGLLNQGSS